MIPVDLTAILKKGLTDGHRPPDGLLHASSDLVGSLRHSQLSFVGAPKLDRDLVSDIRLQTGTMWHSYIGSLLVASGAPVLQEVSVTPWLPEGWSGTADWLFYVPEYEAFSLGDLKTTKGESMKWKEKDGISTEHMHQLSAYFHALVAAGFPMMDKFSVMYLPMNQVTPNVKPEIIEASPLPEQDLRDLMAERWTAVQVYYETYMREGEYLTDALAPTMEPVQKLFWNKDKWDVKLCPHWLAMYCPFPDELCDCNTHTPEKIGHWSVDEEGICWWMPRRGYDIAPTIKPDPREIKRRIK